MNMTLFGVADSCSETMRTAVRSSMESPKEMTSLRPHLVEIVESSEMDDTSVDSKSMASSAIELQCP